MHNKKVLSQAIKDLDKAKAPPKPKDIDYNSMMGFRDDSPFRNKSSMDIYTPTGTIDMSNTGMPLIANGQYLPPYSGTHQFDTNVVTEQPLEQAKKGFEINRPKIRNLKSKKYSRSLEATNELFTVHEFFQKPKSRKNKIYNPNAKYYKKGGGVDPAFEKKLEEVAKRLKVSKADLIGIMKHESGLNPSAVNPSTGATGLIQFMPATARALGTSTEALRNMSAVEQLDYVEKFYRPIAGKAKDIGDLYMFTFLPAAVGKPNDFVIGAKGSGNSVWGISQDALYRQNAGFDLNKKGYYTVGDVKTKISQFSGQPISKEKGIDLLPGDLKPGEEKVTFTSNPVEKEEVKNEPLFPLEYYMQQINPVATTPKSNPLLSLAPKRALNPDIQLELTQDQIKQYVDGGYIVEDLDKAQAGRATVKSPMTSYYPSGPTKIGSHTVKAKPSTIAKSKSCGKGLVYDFEKGKCVPEKQVKGEEEIFYTETIPQTINNNNIYNQPNQFTMGPQSAGTGDSFWQTAAFGYAGGVPLLKQFGEIAMDAGGDNVEGFADAVGQGLDYLGNKMHKALGYQTGGALALNLTDDEIKDYIKKGYIIEEIDQPRYDKGGNVNSGAGMSSKPKTKTPQQIAIERALDAKLANLAKQGSKVPGAYKKDPVFQQVANQTKKNAISLQQNKNSIRPLNLNIGYQNDIFKFQSPIQKYIEDSKPTLTKEQKAQMKAEEDKAVQDAILSHGMLNNPGKLDPEREEFIRNQVRAKYKNASSKYYEDQKEVDRRKAILDPASVLTKSSKYKDVDLFQNQEQKSKEQLDKAISTLITNGAAYNYYKKDSSGKDYKELIIDDLIDASRKKKDIGKVLENIQDKKDESDYNLLKKSYDELPFYSFTGGQDKYGQIWRDFVSDPLNVVEEAFWDKDYMPGRHLILRDPSHPLYNYYTKRTQMDQSPLSQGLQYINPFSSAAEASVAIGKGNYKEGAKQFGEGILKTAGLLAAPEVLAAGSSYVLPGAASIGLPGLTYTAALEGAGMIYGATQLPETYRSIEKAVKSGKKEDWRAAVNQTATNTLDFLGAVDFFKGVTTLPEAVVSRVLKGGSDITGFGKNITKEAKQLEELYKANPLKYENEVGKVKLQWQKAMEQVKAKYADQGFNFSSEEILMDPSKAQYLKDEFIKLKEEGFSYITSDEGRKSIENMLEEFPEFKELKWQTGSVPHNMPEVKEMIYKQVGKEKLMEQGLKNHDTIVNMVQKDYDDAMMKYAEEIQKANTKTLTDPKKIKDVEDHLIFLRDTMDYYKRILDEKILRRDDFVRYFSNLDELPEYGHLPLRIDSAIFDDPLEGSNWFEGKSLTEHPNYIPEKGIYDNLPITVDDYINSYAEVGYLPEKQILNMEQEVAALNAKKENLIRELANYHPNSPEYNKLMVRIKNIQGEIANSETMNMFNAFNIPGDKSVMLGNKFLPGKEGRQILSHEIAHTNPEVSMNLDRQLRETGAMNYRALKPKGYIEKNGVQIPYVTAIDKVLADIDLLPPDTYSPDWYLQNYNAKVKPKEFIPLSPDEIQSTSPIFTESDMYQKGHGNPRDYFLSGSNGNEKETFLAELKHTMLEEGYGSRGKFTEKDLNEFWMNYVRNSVNAKSDRLRLRLLDISDPTKHTRKQIVKALNMPSAYKEGGEIEYDLGDEVDEATMKKLEKQGFVFQKIR